VSGETRCLFSVVLAFLVVSLTLTHRAFADDVNASFEVRLGTGQTNAVLDFGETLNLEVWMTLSSATSFSDVISVALFLDLDDMGEAGLIAFNGDYADASGIGAPLTNGTDNLPVSGELARGMFSITGVPFANGVPTQMGHFSITSTYSGPGPVTLDYAFAAEDPPSAREWFVELAGAENVTPSNGAPLVITVPEPGVATLMTVACVMGVLRRRHR